MRLRNFLKTLIPVCTLLLMSCTNEELILDASQTQRGRAFAEAFKARFDNIDPNHTWIDGTVGKVIVTTDEKANIVVYGLGRSDGTLLRLKRCVVEGTQEVHYDIPMGCEKVVIRAWNKHGDAYKTLNPNNENDEAILLISTGTRAASLQNLSPQAAQEIPNVWNQYGVVAPWETNMPHLDNNRIRCVWDPHIYTKDANGLTILASDQSIDTYANPPRRPTAGLSFYFQGKDGYWYNAYFPDDDLKYYLPTSLFNGDADFLARTGFSANEENTNWRKVTIGVNRKRCSFLPMDTNGNWDTISEQWGIRFLNLGNEETYYNFRPCGKRGSWQSHQQGDYGHFYTTNIDISDAPGSPNYGGDRLASTEKFYNVDLNGDIIDEITDIVKRAEGNYEVLRDYNRDEGLQTLREGPVTVSWFYSETTTRDYVGYYYTEGSDTEADCNAAPKYLLLEATCTNRTEGDTFPLTYYGPDGNGTPTYTFPAGVNIHFFVLHGRDSSSGSPNPHSGHSSWGTQDPTEGYGENANIHPEWQSPRYEWLFYDTSVGDLMMNGNQFVARNSNAANGWTLNAYYACYSHGALINDPAIQRVYNIEDNNGLRPDHRVLEEFEGNYKPMVAFKYAGYNVIGFEDTPVEEWNGLDWNDCVFIVNGNFDVPKINEQDLAFSMCMEDLGDIDDLDYNDLYMVVIQGYEEITSTDGQTHQSVIEQYYAAPKVIIDMAGGILPLKITYEDELRSHLNQTLFEDVHKAFGLEYAGDEMKYATVGQRSTINTYDPSSSDPKNPQNAVNVEPAYSPGEISTVTFTDGAIVKCTNVRSLGDPAKIGHIETWFDAHNFTSNDQATFSIIENIPNFKIYVKYNEGESDEEVVCISGPKNVEVNIGHNTDKIPYAFWFPSTAASEQQSNDNPETRVHPGFERQFIGNYLDGFNEWVAKQDKHGDKTWYDWCWNSDKSWPENNGNQGGGGGGTNPDQMTTSTINISANANPDYYEIPASAFSAASTTVYVKLSYNDNENWKWSNWVINGATVLNPSGIMENYCTEDLSNYISDLKQNGLRIEWWGSDQTWNIPSKIEILYK